MMDLARQALVPLKCFHGIDWGEVGQAMAWGAAMGCGAEILGSALAGAAKWGQRFIDGEVGGAGGGIPGGGAEGGIAGGGDAGRGGAAGSMSGAGSGTTGNAVKEGIYEFPDQLNGRVPYVGQSGNMPSRLETHVRTGRLSPGTETTTEVLGGKTAREVAEYNRIQQLTGGQKAGNSPAVSNERDPVGPERRPGLGLPEPRD